MVKNVKHSSANVRWHLRTLSVARAQNINSAPPPRLILDICSKPYKLQLQQYFLLSVKNVFVQLPENIRHIHMADDLLNILNKIVFFKSFLDDSD